jgi:hypothetical protein
VIGSQGQRRRRERADVLTRDRVRGCRCAREGTRVRGARSRSCAVPWRLPQFPHCTMHTPLW